MRLEDTRGVQAPSRIIIADDHPHFRSAVRHTLEVHPDLNVVGEAANGQEALELCRRLRPELVLMDLRMPVMDGVAATQAIKREFPETLVLILTAVDESACLSDSLEAGAAGYVLKDAPAARVTDTVRRVLAGESPLDEKVATRLLKNLMKKLPRRRTRREDLGSREWSSSVMRCELGLRHTWLCRDERGGSLPDEVGSSPPKIIGGRRRRGMMNWKNLLPVRLGSARNE